jgi:heavy metal efflux system protein
MLAGLIEWSLGNRMIVIALFLLMAMSGLYAATQIPVDAVPDLVNIQVQVVTEAGNLTPLEVERYITYPIELSVSGLPDVEEIRSISRFGISLVTIVFREGTDIFPSDCPRPRVVWRWGTAIHTSARSALPSVRFCSLRLKVAVKI